MDRSIPAGVGVVGWTIGRNVSIEIAGVAATPTPASTPRNWRHSRRRHSGPGATAVAPLLQATRTVPIVFPAVVDPVGAGFVESLARPGGNATGFMQSEYSLSGKWLELLSRSRRA